MIERRAVNTSPLIYLSRAGLLDLLKTDAEIVVVPQAVADEIAAWPTADLATKAIETHDWLAVHSPEPIPASLLAWDLGAGETELLAFGLTHLDYTLVIDDLAARRCAAASGIRVRGTLGLVLLAKKLGKISSARSTLDQLKQAGMYLSDAVINAAVQQVGE